MQGVDPGVIEALARSDIEGADISQKEKLLMRFTETVTHRAYTTTPRHTEELRDAGWTEPQIAEAVYIIALFAFFNRVADAFGLPDPGYSGQFGRLLQGLCPVKEALPADEPR